MSLKEIVEIPFAGIRSAGKEVSQMKNMPGISWSAKIVPPTRLTMFNKLVGSFQLSRYGAISFGKNLVRDNSIPKMLEELQAPNIIIPWGEPQLIGPCGTNLYMFIHNDRLVIDIESRDRFSDAMYQYQYQFPLDQPNIVEVHYYHCVAGYKTIAGMIGDIGEVQNWKIIARQPYMKKAIRFDTAPGAHVDPTEPVIPPGPFNPDPPPDPEPKPPSPAPEPESDKWVQAWLSFDRKTKVMVLPK